MQTLAARHVLLYTYQINSIPCLVDLLECGTILLTTTIIVLYYTKYMKNHMSIHRHLQLTRLSSGNAPCLLISSSKGSVRRDAISSLSTRRSPHVVPWLSACGVRQWDKVGVRHVVPWLSACGVRQWDKVGVRHVVPWLSAWEVRQWDIETKWG